MTMKNCGSTVVCALDCCGVTCIPSLLHTHTKMEISVSIYRANLVCWSQYCFCSVRCNVVYFRVSHHMGAACSVELIEKQTGAV